jgi:UDP-N-acetylmuramoyl-tripeptide--D-alanyl-D-alanine ligase
VRLTAQQIVDATGGALLRGTPEAAFDRFSTDSRTVEPGELFIALVGERFDGNDFLEEVSQRGASGALICREFRPDELPALKTVIRVVKTDDALGKLAAFVRSRMAVPVVGITGSNGKTTTKEFVAAALGADVLKADASFNNLVGVSKTLLRFEPHHRYAVLEIGTNHFGEVSALVEIARPDIGVFLNVTATHTEFLVDEDGIAREKSALPLSAAHAVLNADDPRVVRLAPNCRAVTTFGIAENAHVRASEMTTDDDGLPAFDVTVRGSRVGRVALRTPGVHNVSNALAAIATATVLDVPCDAILSRLATATPPKMRMERLEYGGATLYNDAYNANPASVRAAYAFMRSLKPRGKRWFVFGEMLELGSDAERIHREVLAGLSPDFCDVFVTFGRFADLGAVIAKENGIPAILRCASVSIVGETLRDLLEPGDVALLKASRGVRLEAALEALKEEGR